MHRKRYQNIVLLFCTTVCYLLSVGCARSMRMSNNGYRIENGIIYGGEDYSLPSDLNYGKYFVDCLLKHSEKVALIDGGTGEKVTYGNLAQEVVNVAASLKKLGIKPGVVVAVCSENRREFFTTTIAVCYIGATATFINCNYSMSEIKHTTNISRPKYIFFSPRTYKTYFETLRNLDFVKECYIFGDDAKSVKMKSYKELASKYVEINYFKPTKVEGSDTAIIVYSSGTTGLPKGTKWTHIGLIISGLQSMYESTDRDLVCLSIAPWTNTAGYARLAVTLLNGDTLVLLPKFEEKSYLETIEKYKVNYLLAVPSLVVILCKSVILDNYDVSSVEFIQSGGASLEKNVLLDVKKRFPNLRHIIQAYGMSEATGAISQESEKENKIGSVGKVVPGITMKVVDIKTRKILGPNQPGEICFKGPVLFGGYVDKETPDDYDEEGYYKTGDIAYYDENGYVTIIDRLKELIKYKSWQVAPSELEGLLLQHPGIKDVGVIGTPDQLAGELPTAFIVKQPGTEVTEKEICDFVAAKVSPWKLLRGGVRFIKEIPKNGSGKILRRQLRDVLKPSSKL